MNNTKDMLSVGSTCMLGNKTGRRFCPFVKNKHLKTPVEQSLGRDIPASLGWHADEFVYMMLNTMNGRDF